MHSLSRFTTPKYIETDADFEPPLGVHNVYCGGNSKFAKSHAAFPLRPGNFLPSLRAQLPLCFKEETGNYYIDMNSPVT